MAARRGRRSRSVADDGGMGRRSCSTRPASREAALVGHSMGGAIALEAAAALGERVTRVALLGTAAAIPVHRDLLDRRPRAARHAPTA